MVPSVPSPVRAPVPEGPAATPTDWQLLWVCGGKNATSGRQVGLDAEGVERCLDEAGIGKGELLHVAQSLFHDHVPANRMGIASAWIDRRHDKPGGGATVVPDPMPHYDFRFTSLGELADAHRAEQGE